HKPTHTTQAQSMPNHNAIPLTEATHWQLTATPKAKKRSENSRFCRCFSATYQSTPSTLPT
ncbi:MAG: hypothetical protein KA359_00835, partial [Prevotella sp.]|nr:hypothetical protein [Prevotella sp.]